MRLAEPNVIAASASASANSQPLFPAFRPRPQKKVGAHHFTFGSKWHYVTAYYSPRPYYPSTQLVTRTNAKQIKEALFAGDDEANHVELPDIRRWFDGNRLISRFWFANEHAMQISVATRHTLLLHYKASYSWNGGSASLSLSPRSKS
jgi:hypothetical protein